MFEYFHHGKFKIDNILEYVHVILKKDPLSFQRVLNMIQAYTSTTL